MKPLDIKQMHGEKVLITGGMGFVGSNLAHRLVAQGAEVTLYDSMLEDYGGNPKNIEGIKEKVEVVIKDIRDFNSLKAHVKDKDVIFNCAAQVSHTGSMSDPYLDIDINCRGIMNVLEAVRRFNSSAKVVYTGTRSQVGKMIYAPVDEKHPEFPTDIYSANKSAGEKYHLIYNTAYGIPTTSLRPSNVYGPRAQVKNPGYGVINYFVRLAIQGKTITVYEPGTQTRDCVYVDDVCDALLLAAQKKKADGEVFFVGSGKKVKFIDMVKAIIKAAGAGEWKFIPWPEDRGSIEVGDVSIDLRKIKKYLAWHPKTTLENGLSKTADFYKKNLNYYI